MQIMFGLYKTKAFELLFEKYQWEVYPFYKLIGYTNQENVIYGAQLACLKADKIHFLLDDIFLPLDPIHSITCDELMMIINSSDLLKKTQFWIDEKKIDRELVMQFIKENMNGEHNKQTFNQLIYDT